MFHLESSVSFEDTGGTLHRATKKEYPVLEDLALQSIRLKPGAIREPHLHPNAHQLDYCVSGEARIGVIRPGGARDLHDLRQGDIAFIPQGALHWIENTGDGELHFALILSHADPTTLELSDMVRGVPRDILSKFLNVPIEALDALSDAPITIAGARSD